jgi:hypothetical protein
MFLYELLTTIGFSKIQQLSLVKILFLTGCLSFVEPKDIHDLKETIEINSAFLSSDIKEILLFHQNDPQISDELANKILHEAEFKTKDQAFEWLDSIMQRKFFRGNKERFEVNDQYQNNMELLSLLQNFNLDNEITKQGNFDLTLVLGCNDKCFKTRNQFLAQSIKKGHIHTSKIYIIGADRPGFPYREPTVESILAETLTHRNHHSIEKNLQDVDKAFIQVANEHLKPYNIPYQNNLEDIRKIFIDNPALYQIDKLTTTLQKTDLLKSLPWPNETDIGTKFLPEELKKYNLQIINTPNKKFGDKIVRGNTYDSAKLILPIVENLLKKNTKPKILIVSSQPFAWYQSNIFKSILPCFVDVIAPHNQITNRSILLSELAAIVHTSKYLILKNEG